MADIKSTQQFVPIKEIKDGVVYLKGGGLRRVLAVGGINFDLKSEEEKQIILGSFQSFLNTLDFSLQIFIHSRKINIDAYLAQMEGRTAEEQNELLKIQIADYVEFLRSFVKDNPITMKSFYAVVPYDAAKISSPAKGLLGLFQKKPAAGQTASPGGQKQVEQRVDDQKKLFQLGQRVDEVTQGLEGIGVHAEPLDDQALTELFYNLYNPELVEKEDLAIAQKDATPNDANAYE